MARWAKKSSFCHNLGKNMAVMGKSFWKRNF
jgi:hypothetical protein